MKTKYFLRAFIVFVIPVLFYFILAGFKDTETPNSSAALTTLSPGGGKNFLNCIFNGGIWNNRGDWVETQLGLNRYNDLNFNSIHLYDYINGDANGTSYYGEFQVSLTQDQIDHTNNMLTSAGSRNLKYLLERSKISKLCYAQRLVYEAEGGNNGFSYQTRGGQVITDNGRTVVYACASGNCIQGQNMTSAGWLCKDIYENMQHTDLYNFGPQLADAGIWYMKPMMRIPANTPDDVPVVRIDVVNFAGDVIKQVTLRAMNFKVGGNYNGAYTDKYRFDQNIDSLQVSGSVDDPNGLGYGVKTYHWSQWEANCKVDFRVHWYGYVDVWFDKMTVDDFYANKLFAPAPNNFDSLIHQEVSNFTNHPALYSFFADECTYSNALCIRYVDSVMHIYNPASKLHIALTNYFNVIGQRNQSAGWSYMLQQNPGLYSLNPDAHELIGAMPYDFYNLDSRFADDWKSTDNNDYNLFLQERAFGDRNAVTDKHIYTGGMHVPTPEGSLIYQIELARQQINTFAPGIKMIMQPQIQMWAYYSSHLQKFLYGQREPTNEEIQAQAMLSIAHGADGLCWFWYGSYTWGTGTHSEMQRHINYMPADYQNYSVNASDSFFVEGLINRESEDFTERHSNFYGQDKWNYVKDMNAKILSWKPVLDNTTWTAGYSVHSEGANHNNFIYDILSVDPGQRGVNSTCNFDNLLWYDCPTERYWEMGFYNNTGSPDTKYVMMVNRRCIPASGSSSGDNRVLRIKFNPCYLNSQYATWKLTDVARPDLPPKEFLRTYQNYLDIGSTNTDLGYFLPGEGNCSKSNR